MQVLPLWSVMFSATPKLWNSLPYHVCNEIDFSKFKILLKTRLFNLAFNSRWRDYVWFFRHTAKNLMACANSWLLTLSPEFNL